MLNLHVRFRETEEASHVFATGIGEIPEAPLPLHPTCVHKMTALAQYISYVDLGPSLCACAL